MFGSWKTTYGVRQGGITSTFLFCFHIEEILTDIRNQLYACSFDFTKFNIQAYADDTVVVCPSANGLRSLLNRFEFLFKEHHLVLNIAKTKYLVFRPRTASISKISITLDDVQIESVEEYKFLGSIPLANKKILFFKTCLKFFTYSGAH